MARRKKEGNGAGIILVIIAAIVWGIYIAIRALSNLNERLIETVSHPAGIIALFFGLLIAVTLILQMLFSRQYSKKASALEQVTAYLAEKEQGFEERVNAEVTRRMLQERQQFLDTVALLEKAQGNKESQAEPERQGREEK